MRGATRAFAADPNYYPFQSTLPMRGATSELDKKIRGLMISIHTPHAGSDADAMDAGRQEQNFNPHSPCGERPYYNRRLRTLSVISIHTPHAGSDSFSFYHVRHQQISIHTPHAGSDVLFLCRYHVPIRFQSTLPMRGATYDNSNIKPQPMISIHTPHAGSDIRQSPFQFSNRDFNPHSPCGERPEVTGGGLQTIVFQSTLPMRGATSRLFRMRSISLISIHTPHAGSDTAVLSDLTLHVRFQSTLPMRGATSLLRNRGTVAAISIHTPHAGSDFIDSFVPSRGSAISIHTPHAGSDPGDELIIHRGANFNPHSPCGERRCGCPEPDTGYLISIHTPHAGSDGFRHILNHFDGISIHTPHAGSDDDAVLYKALLKISIHTPHAGSDYKKWLQLYRKEDFNPHSPCGERRVRLSYDKHMDEFQSTLPMRGATRSDL